MHRYHFHVEDGVSSRDTEGVELATLEEARLAAIRLSGEILRDYPRQFWETEDWRMTVTNENGLVLFVVQVIATEAPAVRIEIVPQNPA